MANGSGGWQYLTQEVKRRLSAPVGHFTFWAYLLAGIVGASAFGVWYELLPLLLGRQGSNEAVFTALLTFFPALAGSSALQLVFDDAAKPMRAFAIVLILIFFGFAVWLGFARPTSLAFAYFSAGLACLLAIFVWWITSGQDPAFRDNVDDTSPLGGKLSDEPKGDLKGFKV
jgi:hypothetical protein